MSSSTCRSLKRDPHAHPGHARIPETRREDARYLLAAQTLSLRPQPLQFSIQPNNHHCHELTLFKTEHIDVRREEPEERERRRREDERERERRREEERERTVQEVVLEIRLKWLVALFWTKARPPYR